MADLPGLPVLLGTAVVGTVILRSEGVIEPAADAASAPNPNMPNSRAAPMAAAMPRRADASGLRRLDGLPDTG